MANRKPTAETGLTIVAKAAGGRTPATLQDCAALLIAAAGAEALTGNVRAVAVARSRQLMVDEGGAKPGEWLRWVAETWPGFGTKSHLHHLASIGSMLIRWSSNSVARNTLSCLGYNKNVALARLSATWLLRFLERHDVCAMSREQVRSAVNTWLERGGEPPLELEEPEKSPGRQLPAKRGQLDFFDQLLSDKYTPEKLELRVRDRAVSMTPAQIRDGIHRSLVVVDALTHLASADDIPRIAAILRDEAAALEERI